tara:strand:- start:1385 stop:1915 length:531 start_codon:yes stop_codon:yes gene_type:complete
MINNLIIGAGFTAAITKLLIGKKSKIIGSLSHELLNKNKYLRRKSVEFNKLFANKSMSYGSIKFKLNNGKLHDRLILGGNSGIWGGKVNIKKIPKKILLIIKKKKLFFKKLSFSETGTISNNKNIFQLQNKNRKIASTIDIVNKIQPGYIEDFYLDKKKIFVNIRFSYKQKKKNSS